MATVSKIAWTHSTFNPWIGCTKVHTGCTHCYAEGFSKRTGKAKWGPHGTRVKTSEKYWREPLKWNREAESSGERPRVFCASLADVFEDWQGPILDHRGEQLWQCCNCNFIAPYDPLKTLRKQGLEDACQCSTQPDFVPLGMNAVRQELFKLIDATPNLDWLLLTKRPEKIRRMWPANQDSEANYHNYHRPNVWLGTSISDQETADKFVPRLLECRDLCPVLFLSAEPLLGPTSFRWAKWDDWNDGSGRQREVVDEYDGFRGIDQVIIGVESSGPRVGRLGDFGTDAAWLDGAESIVRQCEESGVAAFVKQVPLDGRVSHEPGEWRPSLQVRQFPTLTP